MSETKDKKKSEKKQKQCSLLEEMKFISNMQIDTDMKETEEYMEDGFESN